MDEQWRKKLPTKDKVYKNDNKLRDYQLEGLRWLLKCWYSRRSCILADEMGLGKTVQIVTMMEHIFNQDGLPGPFLVVVPLSTIEHWRREIETWTDMRFCMYYDVGGGRGMRDVMREYEWFYRNRSRRLLKINVLVTTYEALIRDHVEIAEIPWRVIIVDEAHRLRNWKGKLHECLKFVSHSGQNLYGYQHRVLMTGTPLQNNTQELWSLLHYIEPQKFPDLEKFNERYGRIETPEQVQMLQRRLEPHLLRRTKEDVATDIPAKEETIIDVELTTMQKQYYRAIFERNHTFLYNKTGTRAVLPKLMNIQMELRKCCNHPFLIDGVEDAEMEKLEETCKDPYELDRQRVEKGLIASSGKMVLIDKLLPKLRREGHKVLIFSQMIRVLDLLEEFCEKRGFNVERLDGRVTGNSRQQAIDRFNTNANSFVFLLSTRAGGVGINLTAADTVIIFDSDWNPQNDVQAQARCHRIGQTKEVQVYRLITRRSFESEMFDRASKKLGLEHALLEPPNTFKNEEDGERPLDTPSGDEMEQLLQRAYALMQEDESVAREFCEDDIDKIMKERTHRIVLDVPSRGAGGAGGPVGYQHMQMQQQGVSTGGGMDVMAKEMHNPRHIKRRTVKKEWTPEEDELMCQLVTEYGTKHWGLIGAKLNGRSGKQCRQRCVRSVRPPPRGAIATPTDPTALVSPLATGGTTSWTRTSRRSRSHRPRRRRCCARTSSTGTAGPRSLRCCPGGPTTRSRTTGTAPSAECPR
jgi:chromodomain-helicase-DNA-binding protein 7